MPTLRRLMDACRAAGLPVIHTRECHRPDLADCPPAKRLRGSPTLRIGDPGPMGRVLIDGEPGAEIIAELAPLPGEIVIAKPGKGAFYATDFGPTLERLGVTQLAFTGVTTEVCVQTTMREANDRGYECLLVEDCTESYFARVQGGRDRDDPGAGGDRGLDDAGRAGDRGTGRSAPACGGLAVVAMEVVHPGPSWKVVAATHATPTRSCRMDVHQNAKNHLARSMADDPSPG